MHPSLTFSGQPFESIPPKFLASDPHPEKRGEGQGEALTWQEITPVRLTAFHMPFENIKQNPHAKEATRIAQEIFIASGFTTPKDFLKFAAVCENASHFYSEADVKQLVVCALFISWLYYIDDWFDAQVKHGDDFNTLLTKVDDIIGAFTLDRTTKNTSDPFEKLAHATSTQLSSFLSAPDHARFHKLVTDYLQASLRDSQNDAQERTLSLEEYETQRIANGASLPAIFLLAIDRDLHDFDNPQLTRIKDLCALIMSYFNDIISFPKEFDEYNAKLETASGPKNPPNNLISVLCQERRYGLTQAYEEATEIVNRLLQEFSKIRAALPHNLNGWADGMWQMISGYNDFVVHTTKRYVHPKSYIQELRPSD